MSEDRTCIEKIVSDVRDAWDDASASATEDYTELRIALDHAYRAAWDLKIERVALADLPADEPMINGPMFTSTKHPWPVENGLLAIPIVQLDLATLGALKAIDLGRGLVQLWHGERGMSTRVIPPEDLSLFAAPMPRLVPGETMAAYHFELGGYGLPPFISNPHRIVGYDGPYLFGPMQRDEELDEMITRCETPKPLRDCLRVLRKMVLAGRKRHKQHNLIFGSFDGISTNPSEMPPILFASIDENLLNTGDAGLITLHYSCQDGKTAFSGYFQCC